MGIIMFDKEKNEMIKAGISMDRYGLIALSGGMLSTRMESGEILVSPSGMIYEDMMTDDVLVMDINGNIIEGTKKPSSDTEAVLYVFKHRADLNAIVHTHQPYATAIGLICDEWRVNLTTLANAGGGNIKVSPYNSPGSIDMGIDTVNYLGDSNAVILAHHGVMAVGKNLKQALYAAVYMEESAKGYLAARSAGIMKEMSDAQIKQAVDVFKYYGQGTSKIPDELLKKV